MIEFDKGQTGFLVTVDPASKLISSIEMKVDPSTVFAGITERSGNRDRTVRLESRRDRHRAAEGPDASSMRLPRASPRSIH